jgi:hypothetical protein
MRMMAPLVLTACLTATAWPQSGAPPSGPPAANEKPASGSTPGAQSTAQETPPEARLADGTTVYLDIVEPAQNADLKELPFRSSSVLLGNKLVKEFEKENRFNLVGDSNSAAVVFFVIRYWKSSRSHSDNYIALAVPQKDFKENVTRLNPFRGVAHVEAMLPSALWISEKNYNMGKHWAAGLASAGMLNLGRSNPVDLVREFCRETR